MQKYLSILAALTITTSSALGLLNHVNTLGYKQESNKTITTGNYLVKVPKLKNNQQRKINDLNNLFLKSINNTITYIKNNKLQNFKIQIQEIVEYNDKDIFNENDLVLSKLINFLIFQSRYCPLEEKNDDSYALFIGTNKNLVSFIRSTITIIGIGPITYGIDIMSGLSGNEFKPNTIFQTIINVIT